MTQHEREASRNAHQVIERTLAGLPTRYRISHLIASFLIEGKAALSVEFLLEIATIMAKRLPIDQQTRIVWLLEEARTELRTRWN
jgi:hypothetical protein